MSDLNNSLELYVCC